MLKPSYLNAEKAECVACGFLVTSVSLISFPCVPLYVAAVV